MKQAVVAILRSFWGQAFAALGMFALLLEVIRLSYRLLTLTSWDDLESAFPGGSAIAAWFSVVIVLLVPAFCFHCFWRAPLSRITAGIWCTVAALAWFALDLAWWGDGAEVSSRVEHILSHQLRVDMEIKSLPGVKPTPEPEMPPRPVPRRPGEGEQTVPPIRRDAPEELVRTLQEREDRANMLRRGRQQPEVPPSEEYATRAARYDKVLDDREKQREDFLMAVYTEAITRDPGARAEAIEIASALGVSPDAVENDREVMRHLYAKRQFQLAMTRRNTAMMTLYSNNEFARVAPDELNDIRSPHPGIRFSAAYRYCATQREAAALASDFLSGVPVDLRRLAYLRSRILAMQTPEGDIFGASGAFLGQCSATFGNPGRAMFAICSMLSGLFICWMLLVTSRQLPTPVKVASEGTL